MADGNSLRRKLAIASWSGPSEGNIYGKVTVDAGPALEYLAHVEDTTGEKVTVTHLVGKAVGEALAKEPSLNGYLRLGRYERHDEVALAFLVSMPDGSDLAKAKVRRIDEKSVAEIARDLRERAERLRAGEDDDWERSKGVVRLLPTFLLRPLLWFVGLLSSSFGVEAKGLGIEPFPFGSAIVTSVGMFGLDEAWVPPTPFARVPLYVLIGAVTERPVVVDGAVEVRPQLTITATVDHRFIDGFQGGVLAAEFRRVFQDPWSLDGLDGPPARKATA
ncbi:MAG: 2-oxo acid dehydrogenase subunit E2 [Actinobacteria bacterium]|nr:2-oxo acid dehydrogenase subunit E2 [Actinomycetota bacterium]